MKTRYKYIHFEQLTDSVSDFLDQLNKAGNGKI